METFTILGDGADEVEALVRRSNRLGADEGLVLHGGGNTSCKAAVADALGRTVQALFVKASGTDMRTAGRDQFIALDVVQLRELRSRPAMSDEEMEFHVGRARLQPGTLKPSIETLLHAFLDADHVDHVHADAICSLANHARGREAVEEAFDGEVGFVEFIRPGFELSVRVADLAERHRAVVLAHHGLVTWGATSDEVEAATNEAVERARTFLAKRADAAAGPAAVAPPPDDVRRLTLEVRGALSASQRVVVHRDERLRHLADHPHLGEIVDAGAATADHILAVRPRSLALRTGDDVADAVERFTAAYRQYVARNRDRLPSGVAERSPEPAVVLVPGVGALTAGEGKARARQVADIALHTHQVAADALAAFGEAAALPEEDTFSVEYWPLEMYKLTLRPPPREFDGHVFVVTGAASGIGRGCAEELARRGASLVLADQDATLLDEVADGIERGGGPAPLAVAGDVTDVGTLNGCVDGAVDNFGGLDGVVANAGIATVGELEGLSSAEWERCLDVNLTSVFALTQRALRALRVQGLGGSLVYVASKNAFAPGGGFGAYSVSKAGLVQLARIAAIEGGPLGVRANVVNPDAVIEGSRLWSADVRAERARAHGVAESELEDFYASRSLLGAPVRPIDVAESVAFLLSDRSSRTTGCVITVDSGVAAAFPR